jgi:hypothetical protein
LQKLEILEMNLLLVLGYLGLRQTLLTPTEKERISKTELPVHISRKRCYRAANTIFYISN